MPTCTNCRTQLSWASTLKMLATSKKKLICPNCRAGQYQTQSSAKRNVMVSMLPILGLPISLMLNLSLGHLLILMFAFTAVSFMTLPFIIKLTSTEDPLW